MALTKVIGEGVGTLNGPAFEAYVPSTVQDLTDNTASKMPASTEVFDSHGKYDTSNHRFTPTVAGKYYVYAGADIRSESTFDIVLNELHIYKNGSDYKGIISRPEKDQNFQSEHISISAIIDLDTDDYVEIYGLCNTLSGAQWEWNVSYLKNNYFGAYKLVGV